MDLLECTIDSIIRIVETIEKYFSKIIHHSINIAPACPHCECAIDLCPFCFSLNIHKITISNYMNTMCKIFMKKRQVHSHIMQKNAFTFCKLMIIALKLYEVLTGWGKTLPQCLKISVATT